MVEDGYSEAHIAEICASAGFAAGTFYRYFGSKDEFVQEWFTVQAQDCVAQLSHTFGKASGGAHPGQNRSVKAARAIIEALAEALAAWTLQRQEEVRFFLTVRPLVADIARDTFGPFVARVLQHLSGDRQGVLELGNDLTRPVLDESALQHLVSSIQGMWFAAFMAALPTLQTKNNEGASPPAATAGLVRNLTRSTMGILQVWEIVQ